MVLRYSFRIKELNGNLADCSLCNSKPHGVLTDKLNGEEYWVCYTCFNKRKSQRCKKTSLHIDFRKTLKKSQIHTEKNQDLCIWEVGR